MKIHIIDDIARFIQVSRGWLNIAEKHEYKFFVTEIFLVFEDFDLFFLADISLDFSNYRS